VLVNSRFKSLILVLSLLTGLLFVNFEGFVQLIFGAQSLATWEDPNVNKKINRLYSLLLNPNLLGAYLLVTWTFLLYFSKIAFLKKNFLFFLCLFILVLFNLLLIFKTASRGAWLGLFIQLILYFIFFIQFFKINKLFKSFTIAGLISGFFFIFSQQAFYERLTSLFTTYNHSSNSFRMYVWDSCLKMFFDNFFFGIGPGSKSFYQAYSLYMHANYSALGAYSLILEIGVELGILGLISFVFLFLSLLNKLIKNFTFFLKPNLSFKKEKELWFNLCLALALSGIFVQNLFDIVILRPQVLFTVVFLFFLVNQIKKSNLTKNY